MNEQFTSNTDLRLSYKQVVIFAASFWLLYKILKKHTVTFSLHADIAFLKLRFIV